MPSRCTPREPTFQIDRFPLDQPGHHPTVPATERPVHRVAHRGELTTDMDLTAARSALSTVGLQGERLSAIEGGWSYWTFDLDQAWIARFPRRPEIALAAA